nr:MAG TPA: hypothetical protein [Caudoviricetes sp.]
MAQQLLFTAKSLNEVHHFHPPSRCGDGASVIYHQLCGLL